MTTQQEIIKIIKDAKVSVLKNVNIRQITVDGLKLKIMETKDKVTIKHDKDIVTEDLMSIYELKKMAHIILNYVKEYKRKIIKKQNKEYVSKLFKLLKDRDVVHYVLSYVKQNRKHSKEVMSYIEENIKLISVVKNPRHIMNKRKYSLQLLSKCDYSKQIEKFVEDFLTYLNNKIEHIGSLFDAFDGIQLNNKK